MSLNHKMICINNIQNIETEWENISFSPLSINGIKIHSQNYIEIHDDLMLYFVDIFKWINMYNPSLKKMTKGFCYYGITIIKGNALKKMYKIICSLISLFELSPKIVTLTGDYNIGKNKYEKIKLNKETLLNKLNKINILLEDAIKSNGYILHCGI